MSYTPGPRANPIIQLPVMNRKRNPSERMPWYGAPPARSFKRCLWIYAEPAAEGAWKAHPSSMKASTIFKGRIKGFMMPLGALTAMNYFPDTWEHRLLDERMGQPVTDDDLEWCDIVLLSGMYVEARRANQIARRARELGRISVMGGPGVTIHPKMAPDFDILHIGDLGDQSYEMIRWLDENDRPPPSQLQFRTVDIIPLDFQPLPAYEKLDFRDYLVALVQFQKGCPFQCEFCDVIEIFGRVPESKNPGRYTRELDLLYGLGWRGPVLVVSDNFHANHKTARAALRAIGAWQKAHGYPFAMTTPATLDVSDLSDILELYREAGFTSIGIGLESSDPDTLIHTQKKQNTRHPMADSIRQINSHGVEVVGNMILGFDTDTVNSGKAHVRLVKEANVIMAGCTMLTALEGTQLQRRMEHEGRLQPEWPYMDYKLGFETVRAMFDETLEQLAEPIDMFRRLSYHVKHTRPMQPMFQAMKPRIMRRQALVEMKRKLGLSREVMEDSRGFPARVRPASNKMPIMLRSALGMMWKYGVRWKDRAHYWRFMRLCLQQRDLMSAIGGPIQIAQWAEASTKNKRGEELPREYHTADGVTSADAPTPATLSA
jgi:radical SAM superfamily enzyme YgiQ (UPF0313 family)